MTVAYFDANNNPLSSPLPNPFVTATQSIRVEVTNPINTNCKAIFPIDFVVKPLPKISLTDDEIVCNEKTLSKTINAGILDNTLPTAYTYVWQRNGLPINNQTDYELNITQEGTYTVKVTNSDGCSRTRTINVIASDKANITAVDVVDLATPNSITVYVSGAGDYVYALDDEYGNYQTDATFANIEAGIHTVFVKDLNGCGVTPKEVAVLGIPDFFTPNGDGYHDYWNIKGANLSLNAKTVIHIFDRYGKLIKQISPFATGWGGTFNNQTLPATDYWYSIELENGKIAKGHFALKR
jgi:gliding motility-associated-like protein